MAMCNWMSILDDNLKLSEITMPGSHDAGIYEDQSRLETTGVGLVPINTAICQDKCIYDQCIVGSRFFDVRLEVTDTGVRTHHRKPVLGGALGQGADSILIDVNEFLNRYPSEFVILRITKTKAKTEILGKILESSLKGRLYRTNTLKNIAKCSIKELRGKAVCAFEPDIGTLHPSLGMQPFYRHGEGEYGIVTCGKYSNDSRIKKVVAGQVGKINAHTSHNQNDHLFVLYWTQTFNPKKLSNWFRSKNIRANTTRPLNARKAGQLSGGVHHNMHYLTNLLSTGQGLYGKRKLKVTPTTLADRQRIMPNVVMYDFVNTQVSSEIVSLNHRGLMGHLIDEDDD
ncbi:MAG: hypothetical protein RPU64_00165 [Candidatus Sedimenticola sp. (ex Thyasira tokunagai)]